MADNRKIALYDPKKDSQPLILVPTSLLNEDDYHRFEIPTLRPQFDVYGPTNLDDLDATWKLVWTGEEDLQEHIPVARLHFSKGLGWWNGSVKRLVSDKSREMLIGPVPPALPLLQHAGLGLKGHVKRLLGRLHMPHGKEVGGVLLLQPEHEEAENLGQMDESGDFGLPLDHNSPEEKTTLNKAGKEMVILKWS